MPPTSDPTESVANVQPIINDEPINDKPINDDKYIFIFKPYHYWIMIFIIILVIVLVINLTAASICVTCKQCLKKQKGYKIANVDSEVTSNDEEEDELL